MGTTGRTRQIHFGSIGRNIWHGGHLASGGYVVWLFRGNVCECQPNRLRSKQLLHWQIFYYVYDLFFRHFNWNIGLGLCVLCSCCRNRFHNYTVVWSRIWYASFASTHWYSRTRNDWKGIGRKYLQEEGIYTGYIFEYTYAVYMKIQFSIQI